MSQCGERVGSILLVERLGVGGMGEVFAGVDERLGRRVAVKAMRADHGMDATARGRLAREARMLSRLEHPAICRLYELVETPDGDYLVMELVSGKTLDVAIADSMSPELKLAVAEQVAEALVAAHAMSVIHRDLKPTNVMVTSGGTPKVLDFGLARPAPEDEAAPDRPAPADAVDGYDDAGAVTRRGDVVGTPRFMSPEQAAGGRATAASDMYSFGLLLQEMFTEEPAYGVDLTSKQLLQKARWADTAPLAGLDRGIASLIRALTSLRPEDRPTATEAREGLRTIRERPRRRLRRIALAVVAVSLLLAAAGLGAGWLRARQGQAEAEQARAQAEAVNRFLRGMLESADPRDRGHDVRVVEVLDRAATELSPALSDDPVVQAAVLDAIGSTYHALGVYPKARRHLEQALELRRGAMEQ